MTRDQVSAGQQAGSGTDCPSNCPSRPSP